MRMWNISPTLICNKHLFAEHVEMHMFQGSYRAGKSVAGYLRLGLLDCAHIKARHDELAAEMLVRGKNHVTPMPNNPTDMTETSVDVDFNIVELGRRCVACRAKLIVEYPGHFADFGITMQTGGDAYIRQATGSYEVVFSGNGYGLFLNRTKAEKAMEDLRKGFAEHYRNRHG